MPLYHVPIEDLEDLVEELERSRLERVHSVVPHPVNLGMMLVLTEHLGNLGVEVRDWEQAG